MPDHRVALAVFLGLSWGGAVHAEVTRLKLGGSGLEWSRQDTASILIDYDTAHNAIQPVYITPDESVFSHLQDWSALKTPRELGYEDGERPRAWRGGRGSENPGSSGTYLVDGDSLSSNTPGRPGDFYTIDLAVPVPAFRFGFFTPPRGFRTDGTPKAEDIVRAYEVTVAETGSPAWLESGGYQPIGTVIGSVQENFATNVQLEFPRQYVRYIRYFRGLSSQDETFRTASAAQAREGDGSIGDFELFGRGAPKRVRYVSRILPLPGEVNLGRLFFATTQFRMIDGVPVVVTDADAAVRINVRVGVDDDPNVYHEFTNTGGEHVVSREQYENLSPRKTSGSLIQIGKPGIRASITYDQENWSFWSRSFRESGEALVLPGGSFVQLKILLESEAFDDFVRLDSLWVELSPLLAREVIGELAPLENPRPSNGVTEVDVGVKTDFVLDMRSSFDASTQRGFDAVRIRTGAAAELKELQMGEPLSKVQPEDWQETADGIVVFLPRKVTRTRNTPIRVIFRTSIFVFAQTFETDVFDRGSDDLPQRVRPGDASVEVGTNDLRVLATESRAEVISGMRVARPVFTPNGDGINDAMQIDYDLVRLAGLAPARLRIYNLAGTRVATVDLGDQGTGPQRVLWDGRDGRGHVLPPGIYVAEIAVESESGTFRQRAAIGVAY